MPIFFTSRALYAPVFSRLKHIVVESGANKVSSSCVTTPPSNTLIVVKMKVYGAISSSAEDAPLLHNTHTADEKKKPPLFKGAATSRKTIALAVAGVAACGAVAIVAKGSNGGGNGAPAFRLGDALEDAKAGKKETFVPI